MKLKIGVMGHAGSDLPEKEKNLALSWERPLPNRIVLPLPGDVPGILLRRPKGRPVREGW